jgi:hypothetical protein
MAQYMNQRQMETLSSSLKPSVKRKTAPKTQGKVVPVMKRANPYQPYAPKKPNASSVQSPLTANAMGAAAQQAAIQNRAPVSTQLNVSYESDPVLARIRALGTQDVANARSEAEALRKKAIIDSGLTDVGQEIGVDQNTLQAAQQNPFSTRAELERAMQTRGRELNESLNQQNLFYGGYRADQLSDLARSGAQQQSALTGDIRGLLGGISQGVTTAEQEAARAEQAAIEQAAEDARIAALQQAYLDALNQPAQPPTIVDQLGGGASVTPPAPVTWNNEVYTPTTESIAAPPSDFLLEQLALASPSYQQPLPVPYTPPPIPTYVNEGGYVVPDPIYEPDYAASNAVNIIPGADWRYL